MTRTKTFGTFIGISAALYALPVLAEETAAQEGLPQLDPAHFPSQLFWLAVTFALLYVCMQFVALPGVKRTQDKRVATIEGNLKAAQAANEAAKRMMADYEKALTDARAKAQATVSEIAAQAAKESAAKQAVQQQELAKRLAEAEAKIAAARDAAVRDVKSSAADLAAAIIDKVTKPGARHVG
jgi:F-type H+-transporting ATPase subunit b